MKITITQDILIDGQHHPAGCIADIDADQAKGLVLINRASLKVDPKLAKKLDEAAANKAAADLAATDLAEKEAAEVASGQN